MKKNIKKISIIGGALVVLFLLYKNYNKKVKPNISFKPKGKPNSVKPPKKENPNKPTPTPTPPFIPQSSGGGTGSVVTNNQTVPPNYNPRDYGDIVLGSVDRGGNIRR
jgi:hypothetical protein